MRPTVLAVLATLAVACQNPPTMPDDTVQPVAAVAGGPVTISRGEGTFQFGGLYRICGGELITATGQTDYSTQIVSHPSGAWMFTSHQRLSMDGTTASGEKFRGVGTGHTSQVIAVPTGGAVTYTMTFNQVLVTQGRADNQVYRAVVHFVIDASGKVAVNRVDIEVACRG